MNDISVYYTEERALAEEVEWILRRPHAKIIDWLTPRLDGMKNAVEFGCGSGIIAAALPPTLTYLGIDSNEHFLAMARKRCQARSFSQYDVRDFDPECSRPFDVAMAWNFFKHFSLAEWNAVVCCVLAHGRYGAFNAQVTAHELDNGTDYHHVHVSETRLAEAIRHAGHREVERTVLNEWTLQSGTARDVAVWTEKINA